jgi:hypothetical protein
MYALVNLDTMSLFLRLITCMSAGLLGMTIVSLGSIPEFASVFSAPSLVLGVCALIAAFGFARRWNWTFPVALSAVSSICSTLLFILSGIRVGGAPPTSALSLAEVAVSLGLPVLGCALAGVLYEVLSKTQNILSQDDGN